MLLVGFQKANDIVGSIFYLSVMNSFTLGCLNDGRLVQGFLLENALGMQVKVMEYGATLTHFVVPDQAGKKVDIVLGFPGLSGYLGEHPYLGATVGRYANRIAHAKFELDDRHYQLSANEGEHILHGGPNTIDKAVWSGTSGMTHEGQTVWFRLMSPDGHNGFPGTVKFEVSYTLSHDGELIIRYRAETDQPTVLNLTNHAYFNLDGRGSVRDTWLQMNCEQFTPGDEGGIPSGEIRKVSAAMDFLAAKQIGHDLDDSSLADRNGYDHNYIVNGSKGMLRTAATAWSDRSGIKLTTWTTEPCVQFYTGNWLNESGEKRGGIVGKNHAFCLETQHAPDAPNCPEFDSPVLRPGEVWESETRYGVSLISAK